jgi:Ca2+-binding RTX toxin-like protein
VLVGNANANALNGDDGDDSLQGEAGDDSLDGGTGDDTLDGGEGQDVVMYSGELSDYKVTYDQDSQSWRVEDVNLADGQDDGTDTLTGIEVLALADQDYPLLVGVVSGEW